MEMLSVIEKIFGKTFKSEFHVRILSFAVLVTSYIIRIFYPKVILNLNIDSQFILSIANTFYVFSLILIVILFFFRVVGHFWIDKDMVLTQTTVVIMYIFFYMQSASNLFGWRCGIEEFMFSVESTFSPVFSLPLYAGALLVGVYAILNIIDMFTDV